MLKYLILLLPLTVYAGDNNHRYHNHHEEQEIRTEIVQIETSETVYEKKVIERLSHDLNGAVAANAAIASIPAISHKTGHIKHQAVGVGFGHFDGSQAVAVGYETHKDNKSFKLNVGFSESDTVYGAGISCSF